MVGNDPIRIRLQDRDRRLLQELGIMRVIDREQAKAVAPFTSTSAANVRLLALTRAGLLKRTFVAGSKAVYRLSVEAERNPKKHEGDTKHSALFLEHQLAINELYVRLLHGTAPAEIVVRNWARFEATLAPSIPLIPDGFCEIVAAAVAATFLEVDLGTEPQRVWQRKARLYVELATSSEFATRFGHQRFRVLVVAATERRIEGIRATIANITDRLFWFASFQTIYREGLWAPIWLRPKGDMRSSLV